MTITGIERQKHNSERFSVFIDHEFAFGMSGADVLYYKLEPDAELTPERYDFLVNEVLVAKARERAFRCLATRARTRKEMADKLTDYPPDTVEQVIAMLEEHGYIDDYRFAADYAEARMRSKGYGRLRLWRELREKGVDKDIIEEALANTDFDEAAAALDKLTRRAKGEPLDERGRKRHFDYLARQGYGYGVIKQAFKDYEAML